MDDDEDLASRPRLTGQVSLVVDGVKLDFDLQMPDGLVSLDDLIPLFQGMSSLVVEAAKARADAAGAAISCRAGCGACCRQAVPITEGEARYLADLVHDMPEPRRSEIIARFAAVYQTLEDSEVGRLILETLRVKSGLTKELIIGYFNLGIACPFLEDESCSIHAQRPMICREYMVSSDPAYCAALDGEHIARIRLTGMHNRVARVGRRDTPRGYVQLFEALTFAADHPPPPRDRAGPDILLEVIKSDTPRAPVGSLEEASAPSQASRS